MDNFDCPGHKNGADQGYNTTTHHICGPVKEKIAAALREAKAQAFEEAAMEADHLLDSGWDIGEFSGWLTRRASRLRSKQDAPATVFERAADNLKKVADHINSGCRAKGVQAAICQARGCQCPPAAQPSAERPAPISDEDERRICWSCHADKAGCRAWSNGCCPDCDHWKPSRKED